MMIMSDHNKKLMDSISDAAGAIWVYDENGKMVITKKPNSKYASNVGNQYWQTPKDIFDKLNREFHFKLDAATTNDNPLKTKHFYTEKENGLKQPWITWTYCNPPYSQCGLWVKKAYSEMMKNNTKSVLLLPASVDTNWFHYYIWNKFYGRPLEGISVRFYHGRIKFVGANDPAKFSSMFVIFHGIRY